MRRTDFISAVTLIALGLAALLEASKLPFGRVGSPQAGFFPLILAGLLAILSLVFLAQAIGAPKERPGESPGRATTWNKIVLAIGALVVFALLFESLGYVMSTFLFIAFLLSVVERQKWSLVVIVAFFTSLTTYVVFGLLLNTPLPGGILGI